MYLYKRPIIGFQKTYLGSFVPQKLQFPWSNGTCSTARFVLHQAAPQHHLSMMRKIMCIYIYVCIYTHTHIHTFIHSHPHTHKHTYIQTYITLHYITLHYITLHYATLHYTTLHYITLHYITYIHTYIYTYPNAQCIEYLPTFGPLGEQF